MTTQRDRDDHGKFVITEAELEERRAKVVELKVGGYSFREIGKQLGINEGTACRDYRAVIDRTKADADETVEEERRTSLARLGKAIRVLMPLVEAGSEDAIRRRIDAGEDIKLIVAQTGLALDAMDRLDKLERRRAALLGLDAPTRSELTGKDGAPVPVDHRGSLIERLAGLIAGATPEGGTGEDPCKPDGS